MEQNDADLSRLPAGAVLFRVAAMGIFCTVDREGMGITCIC